MLRVLMVACSNVGTVFWRLKNFSDASYRTKRSQFHVLGWDKNEEGAAQWQFDIADIQHQPKLFGLLYSGGVQADAIVFQRLETEYALTAFYAMRDQFPDKPIISEVDDDILNVPSYNQAHEGFKSGSNQIDIAIKQFKNSDALIVSTEYLKELYSQYCPNIYVIPNCINISTWKKLKRRKRSGIRIGWAGGTSHLEDLRLLIDIIPKVLAANKDVRFVFLSNHLPDFLKGIEKVEIIEKWKSILNYPQLLASQGLDIGLAPLRDNGFNRAKSNLRWLEYSALRIPCVASNVGHFAQTIKNGKDGFLVNDSDEFADKLIHLVNDSKARKEMGRQAFQRIEQDFNVDRAIVKYMENIKDVLTRPVIAAPSISIGMDDINTSDMTPLTQEIMQ